MQVRQEQIHLDGQLQLNMIFGNVFFNMKVGERAKLAVKPSNMTTDGSVQT